MAKWDVLRYGDRSVPERQVHADRKRRRQSIVAKELHEYQSESDDVPDLVEQFERNARRIFEK